jgi:ribosomal protein S18 acetylase RimI-like enzyme
MMSGSITVRYACESDLPPLSERLHLEPLALDYVLRSNQLVVAERDGAVAGFLLLQYLWYVVPYISLIWVLPGQRGSGIGKSLLEFVESHLAAQGHTALYSSSQADEPQPQAWHRRMGFEDCGIIVGVNAGSVGELFFRKSLAPRRLG